MDAMSQTLTYDIDVAKITFNNGGCIGHQSGVVTCLSSFITYLPIKDYGTNNNYYIYFFPFNF